METFYKAVTERMIRYARVGTGSLPDSGCTPSTVKQFDLAGMLAQELENIGVPKVWMDEKNCVVYGWIPSNCPGKTLIPVGYIAHMDTSPDAPNDHVNPWVLENYDGKEILLNKEQNIVMRPEEYPNLLNYIGQDLVLTDGTTLLGADDKASIAAMMTAFEYIIEHPEFIHGPICIAFTPDEEVAGLAKDLDLDLFGAQVAYTLDGDHLGHYEYETFNATEAQLTIHGLNVHPGTAKGIMINAVDIAAKFIGMLPDMDRPQYTEGREGFYHPHRISGDTENAKVFCLIRDHDDTNFKMRKNYITRCVEKLNQEYGEGTVELVFTNGYRSMRSIVEQVPFMIDYLKQAISEAGIEPKVIAFRGGTDGSALSWRGLPCPNLSAGYENAHGRFEYVPVQSMVKNVEILLNLFRIYADHECVDCGC